MLQHLAEMLLPKEYTFDGILEEAPSFQAGKKYTYPLEQKPGLSDLTNLVYLLQDDRRDLTVLVEYNGDFAITLLVFHAV